MEKIKEFFNKIIKSTWTKLVFLVLWYSIVTAQIGYQKEAQLIAYTIVFAILLYLITEKLLKEYQNKKSKYVDKRSQDEIEETAYHEAAHAVVCRIASPNVKIEKITIICDGYFGGYVKPINKKGHMRKADFLADLQVGMAGLVLEELLYGGHSDGCLSDIKNLKHKAHFIINDLSMGKKFFYGKEDINEMEAEMAEMLNETKAKTKELVSQNMTSIEALKNELLEKKEMNSQDVEDFFRKLGI